MWRNQGVAGATLLECAVCGRQTSVTAGTIIQDTERPARTGAAADHPDNYLDAFTPRFNRRISQHRGKLFYRLAQQAIAVGPAPFKRLIANHNR